MYKIGYNKILIRCLENKTVYNQKITKDLNHMVKSHRLSGSGYPKQPNYIDTNEKNKSQNHFGLLRLLDE